MRCPCSSSRGSWPTQKKIGTACATRSSFRLPPTSICSAGGSLILDHLLRRHVPSWPCSRPGLPDRQHAVGSDRWNHRSVEFRQFQHRLAKLRPMGPVTPVRPHSTANTYDVGGDIEFGRWLLATVIAVAILLVITGLAFLIDGMWRRSGGDRGHTEPPPVVPGRQLLDTVTCNSTLCSRYSELISSCVGHGGGSPCEGLSRFVCGEGACFGRPLEVLVRGFLRALAADALASWDPQSAQQGQPWPAVDRAAALYKRCREITALRDGDLDAAASVRDSVDVGELRPFLATNETAAEMATRLAARYQDGALFWLEAAAPQRGESKRRLVIRANRQFVRHAEYRDSSSRRRRRSLLRTFGDSPAAHTHATGTGDVAESILNGMDHVHALWKKAGNLLAYNPELVTLGELDRYGLVSAVLIRELNLEVVAPFSSNDSVEVVNGSLRPFLSEVLQLENIKTYLAWEFVRHRWACAASPRIQKTTLADSCFDCVERVAGLAAHGPFLRVSAEVESQAKASVFLTDLKNFVVTAVGGAKWLSTKQRQLMIARLFTFQFVRGAPAHKDGVTQINDYYAYLPNDTGSFERDFDAAAHAAWSASLRRTAQPQFPLLSAFPNVLSGNNTAYIPAVALVPPLFSYGEPRHTNYGFLGLALIRALVHSLGLTGLLRLPEPRDAKTTKHLEKLGDCLRPSRSSTQAYASQMADVFALGAAVQAFVEDHRKRHKQAGDADEHQVFTDGCLFMCTSASPHRCDAPVGHTALFGEAFSCPPSSHMLTAHNCTAW
ncbi:hypothetical protein HPB50_024674 [Hyalomma asiaticum]|uniref:Uncharacterized protein n=1 Tax=Hyalomma asiaticum TaxID=266040 RepID=A0ACB7SBL8_HYAAI|nr:hypothetical protein HPB50_024674 [Hyalomma asiaticum]